MTTQLSTDLPTDEATFNLVDRPWIRCSALDGADLVLSLREVFERAAGIGRLAGDTPAQDYAVLRVLLVILWRAHRDDPRLNGGDAMEMSEWWMDHYQRDTIGDLVHPVVTYLEQHRSRFDLFDTTAPFMQVADLGTSKGGHDGVRKLIPDAESDYFTMRSGPGLRMLPAPEAARWLIHLQGWNYSGIKSGAVGDERVKGGKGYPIGTGWNGRCGGVVLHGSTLAETLLLNTAPEQVFGADRSEDLPVWERQPGTAAARGTAWPTGPCDLLTWQSRRVRLVHEDEQVTGILVTNGDKVELRNQFADPMTAYRYSTNQSSKVEPVHMPKAHDPSRTLWRGIEPLLVRQGLTDGPVEVMDKQPATVAWLREMRDEPGAAAQTTVTVELVGMTYGPQDATITAAVHEEMPLRLAVLADADLRAAQALVSAATQTMKAAVAVGRFAGNLSAAAGGEYQFNVGATEALLNQLNEPFKTWLEQFNPGLNLQEQRSQWFDEVNRLAIRHAQVLVRGAGPRGLIGREDAEGRVISAATAWSKLTFSLNKTLDRQPSADRDRAARSGDELTDRLAVEATPAQSTA